VRAAATRTAILNVAHGSAGEGTVIDGGALTWAIGGVTVRLETDALAWWVGGKLRVIEMKSYPVEWGQISADNIIALSWQTAVYVAAVQDLLEAAGEDPGLVSTVIFLICPKNTSLKPVIVPHDVAPQLRLLRRFQFQQKDLSALASRAGPVTVDLPSLSDDERALEVGRVIELLEPSYQPNCLSTCELAPHCRGKAQERGEAAAISAQMVQLVGGTGGMLRAAALLAGEVPMNPEESEFINVVAAEDSIASLVQASSRPGGRP
jgi:hypothetical protein